MSALWNTEMMHFLINTLPDYDFMEKPGFNASFAVNRAAGWGTQPVPFSGYFRCTEYPRVSLFFAFLRTPESPKPI